MSLDDSEEFSKIAVRVADDDDDISEARSFLNSLRHTNGKEKEKKKLEGSLCQYASLNGEGFVPTSLTVPTLPPDSYRITITMDGQVVFVSQKIVTDSLLRLPDSRSDEVIAEVEHFWTLKDKFKEYGFAHKRGFLLFGPPGSGKTSTIAIIISEMIQKGGIVILGENPDVLAKGLQSLRKIESERPVAVILEDVDTIIQNYGEATVLSVLDGEAQVDNVVYIATTNYPERLDGRITNRPSRFDKIVKIGTPNAAAREMYMKTKIADTVHQGVDLVKETEGFSIAHIKELIIGVFCQGNDPTAVLARLKKMKVLPKSDSDSAKIGL